jgi:hypothetical protein
MPMEVGMIFRWHNRWWLLKFMSMVLPYCLCNIHWTSYTSILWTIMFLGRTEHFDSMVVGALMTCFNWSCTTGTVRTWWKENSISRRHAESVWTQNQKTHLSWTNINQHKIFWLTVSFSNYGNSWGAAFIQWEMSSACATECNKTYLLVMECLK